MSKRIFKPLVYWSPTPEGRAKPQIARMQVDTGADRTVLAKMPPGAKIIDRGCLNDQDVDLVEIVALIPETNCNVTLFAAVPKKKGALPPVIGTDFFSEGLGVIDYREAAVYVGCPPKKGKPPKGFAGTDKERTGVMKYTSGRCSSSKRTPK